jgi:hypothetical protein
MKKSALLVAVAAVVAGVAAVGLVYAAEGYKDTPMLPGGKWHVHDSDRPAPPVVTPGTCSTPEAPGKAPSDAVVLFDGKDLSKWKGADGKDARWVVEGGAFRVQPGAGEIKTKQEFADFQLHVEWAAPTPPKGGSQDRGNSGVFLFGRYEIQVLDSYKNPTYADGSAASIYGEYPPLVNATLPPGEWQAYDIVFIAPRFKEGKLDTPAYVTMFHNGLLVHNRVALFGATGHKSFPGYSPHGLKGPITLQDHGNPVKYRNIWIREIKDYDQP